MLNFTGKTFRRALSGFPASTLNLQSSVSLIVRMATSQCVFMHRIAVLSLVSFPAISYKQALRLLGKWCCHVLYFILLHNSMYRRSTTRQVRYYIIWSYQPDGNPHVVAAQQSRVQTRTPSWEQQKGLTTSKMTAAKEMQLHYLLSLFNHDTWACVFVWVLSDVALLHVYWILRVIRPSLDFVLETFFHFQIST